MSYFESNLPAWECHKIVKGFEIGKIEGLRIFALEDESMFVDVPPEYFVRNNTCSLPGYFVAYEDGYISWSPKPSFEKGYTRIDVPADTVDYEQFGNQVELESIYTGFDGTKVHHIPCIGHDSNEVQEGIFYMLDNVTTALKFQHGTRAENGINGFTMEEVIAALIHRLETFNKTLPSKYNESAIVDLRAALFQLEDRIKDRIARDVIGTDQL